MICARPEGVTVCLETGVDPDTGFALPGQAKRLHSEEPSRL